MAQAYYRLEHKAIGRRTKTQDYASAVINYAANSNKCSKILSINFRAPKTNLRYAIAEQFQDLANQVTRKDGNLFHSLIISHPVEMTEQHRQEATFRFMLRVSMDKRIYVVAYCHDQQTHNPHAHVYIVDRDVETGERVANLSTNRNKRAEMGLEPNPTEWLRRLWEEEGNAVLAEHGYEIRLDRRSNLERGLEQAGQHRGVANENHIADVTKMVEEEHAIPYTDDTEPEQIPEALLEDEPEAAEAEPVMDDEAYVGVDFPEDMTPVNRVKAACSQQGEIEKLHLNKNKLDQAISNLAKWNKMASEALKRQSEAAASLEEAERRAFKADQLFSDTRNFLGMRKGVSIGIGSIRWKSASYKKAEHAEKLKNTADFSRDVSQVDYDHAKQYYASMHDQVNRAEHEVKVAQERYESVERYIGTMDDLQLAEKALAKGVEKYLETESAESLYQLMSAGEITKSEFLMSMKIIGQEELAMNILERDQQNDISY